MAGQALVARLVPTHIRVAENTAGGTIYAAVYVLYAPSLAFSLFIVWGEYREAQRTTNTEADTLEGCSPKLAGQKTYKLLPVLLTWFAAEWVRARL
jgi:hypothetical protein